MWELEAQFSMAPLWKSCQQMEFHKLFNQLNPMQANAALPDPPPRQANTKLSK